MAKIVLTTLYLYLSHSYAKSNPLILRTFFVKSFDNLKICTGKVYPFGSFAFLAIVKLFLCCLFYFPVIVKKISVAG